MLPIIHTYFTLFSNFTIFLIMIVMKIQLLLKYFKRREIFTIHNTSMERPEHRGGLHMVHPMARFCRPPFWVSPTLKMLNDILILFWLAFYRIKLTSYKYVKQSDVITEINDFIYQNKRNISSTDWHRDIFFLQSDRRDNRCLFVNTSI